MIENSSQETLLNNIADTESMNEEMRIVSEMDENRILRAIPNKRFAYVLKRLVIEQDEPQKVAEELNITVDNLYNIKKRAISSLTKMVLNEIGSNGK